MKRLNLEKLDNLLYFSTASAMTVFSEEKKKTIETNLYRWAKNGTIIGLKRGLYITKAAYTRYGTDNEFRIFLGCIMKYPSYLTAEAVLRDYDMLTEATFGYTYATTKHRSEIINKIGTFIYKEIKPELFTGYEIKYYLGGTYYMATKAKALFDYLYFRADIIPYDKPGIDLVEDLRLNLDTMRRKDYRELRSYIRLTKRTKVKKIINNIITNAPNNS